MLNPLIVRDLTREDAPAWAKLRWEALLKCPLAFNSSVPGDPGILVEEFISRSELPGESIIGAINGSLLVGSVGVRRFPKSKENHKVLIVGMYVTAESRRSGAGEALLRAAIEKSKSWPGVLQVHLSVNELARDAHRLYERNGFHEWGRAPRALHWKGSFVDAIHMVLEL